jgi:hypothetical protein
MGAQRKRASRPRRVKGAATATVMKEESTMRSRLLALGGCVVFLATAAAVGVRAQTSATRAAVQAPVKLAAVRRERHPELVRAVRALQRARVALQNAARDFGGHRARAEQLTDQAIREVQAAMAADRT